MVNRKMQYMVFFFILLLLMPFVHTEAKEKKDIETELAEFHYSVMNHGGYITCAIDIVETKKNGYKFEIMFKENITGVDLGFYTTPYIIDFFEKADIKYDSVFQEEYMYSIGSRNFASMEELSETVSMLPFFVMISDENGFYAQIDLTIWDDLRKEEAFIDDIYATNAFLFSFRPLKPKDTNASSYKDGVYAWTPKDGQVTGMYLLNPSGTAGKVILVVGILILAGGVFLIIKNPFQNRNSKNNYSRRRPVKRQKVQETDEYGYWDDDWE